MKNKLVGILVCAMLVLTTVVVIVPNELNVGATSGGGGGDNGDVGLDYSYIFNITENLSNVIFDAPLDSGIRKGRDFGTEGEQYAAINILKDTMINDLNLYSPPELDIAYLQKIDNISSGFEGHIPSLNLTNDIEIKSLGITVHDLDNETDTTVSEFYIQPMWNWRFWPAAVGFNFTNQEKISEILEDVFNLNPSDWYGRNMRFNKSWLTKNYSWENVKLVPRPTNISWIFDVIINLLDEILANESIVDWLSLMKFILPEIQDYHGFKFGDLTPENASENLEWFNEDWLPPSPIGGDENFVYISEDHKFNINATDNYPCLKTFLEAIEERTDNGFIINNILSAWTQIELWAWNRTMPNCKGLLLFDANDDVYNVGYSALTALPVLQINGSIGKTLNNSRENYTIDFHLDQEWEEHIESYNVIGQINGTNTDETVILDCLYDGRWNQASADSAVGIGIVLGIAKYFQDNNIKPKCNIKFIGFGGEEHGLRGAYYYNATNNDKIKTVIDLNQLGIAQTDPRLTLNIVLNNESINSTIGEIAEDVDYVDRTDDTSDLKTMNTEFWAPLSDYTPFKDNESINTICFIEEDPAGRWFYHHRDGQEHEEGDSMNNVDWNDVNVTAELIWNVTKYYTVDPDCWFTDVTYEASDSDNDGDSLNDYITANFTIDTIMPHDQAMVKLFYQYSWDGNDSSWSEASSKDYIVTSDGLDGSIVFQIPDAHSIGDFSVKLELYNSTGRVNEIVGMDGDNYNETDNSSTYRLYHSLGYAIPGDSTQNVEDRVTGVAFTANENASANNITVYLQADFTLPPPKGKCMIYRSSDSALIGTTGEITVATSAEPEWKVFTFYADPLPQLVQGVEYVLVCWADDNCYVYYDDTSLSKGRYKSYTYGLPPFVPSFTNEDRLYSIYCTYTPS